METVAGLGPMGNYGHVELHHFLGATTQVKGVGNLGHWAIIPISAEDHFVRHNQGPRSFEHVTGKTEKGIFIEVCKRVEDLPFGIEIEVSTPDTNALIEEIETHTDFPLSHINLWTDLCKAIRTLSDENERYQEKAIALHKYLRDKNIAGIEAVITEFSLMAEHHD